MRVLAIETAGATCGVALLDDDKVVAMRQRRMAKGHAETLPPMAIAVAAEVGPPAIDAWRDVGIAGLIDRVVVVTGPGSFAGVRVGLALARGLGAGSGIDVVGVDALAALHASHSPAVEGPVAVVADARRGEVFASFFDADGRCLDGPFAASYDAASTRLPKGPLTLVGDGARHLPDPHAKWRIDDAMRDVSPIALSRLGATLDPAAHPPTPVYLRAPDAAPSAAGLLAGLAPAT